MKKVMEKISSIIYKYKNINLIGVEEDENKIIFELYDYLDKPGNFEHDVGDMMFDIKDEVFCNIKAEFYKDTYWDGDTDVETYNCRLIVSGLKEKIDKIARIAEIKEIINNFAARDLYSANCTEVKYLYRELHQLEAELEDIEYEEPEEDYYEPVFIGGSDVPINGRYE